MPLVCRACVNVILCQLCRMWSSGSVWWCWALWARYGSRQYV